MINAELGGDGYRPPQRVWLALSATYRGVAKMCGDHIVGSADHFRGHREDVGAIVHEPPHVAQGYRRGERPSWLVEGICDYIRFFHWEQGNLGRINPETAHYNKSYRVTAAFLAYLVEKYDKDIVRKLNRALREGRYQEGLFEQITGKTVRDLDDEWRASLRL